MTGRKFVENLWSLCIRSSSQVRVLLNKLFQAPTSCCSQVLQAFADWLGSSEDWFTFGAADDCSDLQNWFNKRRAIADQELDAIGWEARVPLSHESKSFEQVFGFAPRPLQQAVTDALNHVNTPVLMLMEAPMGEGKTEAAFFAHLELQRRFGHRGLYVALPTKATGNAMFKRTLKFLRRQGSDRKLDLQLLHGATFLNDTFQNLRFSGIHDPATGGEIRAGEWFTHKKRALLSEYGVGTVDQALLPILPVRHNFVRLWGLANRVVVFDEIHAYDAYTSTLLVHLVRWLLALGSSVVLLSATLSPSIRRKLADVVNAHLPEQEEEYPRISVFLPGAVEQIHFKADPTRRLTLRLKAISPDLTEMRSTLEVHLANGGWGWRWSIRYSVHRNFTVFFLDGAFWSGKASVSASACPMGQKCFSSTPAFRLTVGRNARIRCWRSSGGWHPGRPKDSNCHTGGGAESRSGLRSDRNRSRADRPRAPASGSLVAACSEVQTCFRADPLVAGLIRR